MSLYKSRNLLNMTEVMVWSRHIYCIGHRDYLEPLESPQCWVSTKKKAGSSKPDYASTYMLEHNLAPARMTGVEYESILMLSPRGDT